MKRKLLACTALVLCLALLCGCTSIATSEWMQDLFPVGDEAVAAQQTGLVEGSTAEQEVKQVVTETYTELDAFGLAYQPDYGLHPYNCESLNNRVIFSFLYEPLFAVTQELDAVPILAKDYSVSDDGTATTITLQSGVRFHTGQPLTAEDVVYSLESSRGSTYYGSRLRDVTSIEALDAQTVVLTTTVAYDELPLLLDIPIIQKDTLEQDVPPGTGPYKFESTERLVRNADWWQGGTPLVDYDEITLTSVSTTAEIRDNFEYENINMVLTDPNSAAYAGFHNDYELWTAPTTVMQYIGYNLNSNVFSNYGLRSAITYAIDRETLVTEQAGGFATASSLPCPPQAPFYDARQANSYSYSPSRFHEQLESASVKDMDGDGVCEIINSSPNFPAIYYKRGGQLYGVDLKSVITAAWQELNWWDYTSAAPDSRSVLFCGLSAGNAPGDGVNFTRYLYFDGENLLLYKPDRSHTDHIADATLADPSVPAEVAARAKQLVRQRYDTLAGSAAQYDDWYTDVSFLGAETRYEGLTLEVYSFSQHYHAQKPEKIVLAGGTEVDEDGWAVLDGDTVLDGPYIVCLMDGGTRRMLEGSMSGDCSTGSPAYYADLTALLAKNNVLRPDALDGGRLNEVMSSSGISFLNWLGQYDDTEQDRALERLSAYRASLTDSYDLDMFSRIVAYLLGDRDGLTDAGRAAQARFRAMFG